MRGMDASGAPLYRRRQMSTRTFLAPEVIQTSAMDCGPAALKCLLAGFGIPVALRPAARGVSDLRRRDVHRHAGGAGPDAGARRRAGHAAGRPLAAGRSRGAAGDCGRAPAVRDDPLRRGLARARAVRPGDGSRRAGGGGCGARRSCATSTATGRSFPADAFAEWAGGDGFTGPLGRRLRALGVADPGRRHRAGESAAATGARSPRWTPPRAPSRRCANPGRVSRGAEAGRLVDALAAAPGDAAGGLYAFATAAPRRRRRHRAGGVSAAPFCCTCRTRASWTKRRAASCRWNCRRPSTSVRRASRGSCGGWRGPAGRGRLAALAVGLVLAGVGAVAEGLLFRSVVDALAGPRPGTAVPVARREPRAS